MAKEWHDCEKSTPEHFLTSGYRQDGEEWVCPTCGEVWVFCEDEAEGGFWLPKTVLEEL